MKQATKAKAQRSIQIGKRLREGAFILLISVAVYMFIALTTYNGGDPGWSHSGHVNAIENLAGNTGAFSSDFLYSLFGLVAYLFPVAVLYFGLLLYRGPTEQDLHQTPMWIWGMRVLGLIFALSAGCGLTALHISLLNSFLPMGSGGMLGSLVQSLMVSQLNHLGSTVILLAFFLSGITLLTGLSWLGLMDMVGRAGFKTIALLKTGDFSFINKVKVDLTWWKKFQAIQWIKKSGFVQQMPVEAPVAKKPAKVFVENAKMSAPLFTAPEIRLPEPKEVHFASIDDDSVGDEPSSSLFKPKKITKDKPKVNLVKGKLVAPSLSLLEAAKDYKQSGFNKKQLEDLSRLVETRLAEFGVQVKVVAVLPGPVVTRFELELAPGIKVSKISGLAKDLARSLSVVSVRVVEVIAGKSVVGLEIPNEDREIVRLKEILQSAVYQQADSFLTLGLGKDIAGRAVVADLAKMPHLLVAGTTGSGKSVGLNAMLLSILYKATPEDVRLIMIDPKMLELAVYDNIPHLLTPVVTDMKDAANALKWCVAEMDYRYQLMAALGVRNLASYNRKVVLAQKAGKPIMNPLWQPHLSEKPEPLEKKPYVVVVVDEFADMIMVVGKKVEELIARIAQKARAAGIHLILATQRPSVDVITGLIKANIPTRISFQVSSRIDSRTILDQQGAEQLLGHGDMLYLPPGVGIPQRIHGAFVADEEVHKVCDEWRRQGSPDYIESVTNHDTSYSNSPSDDEYDELYDESVKIVTESRRASISHVQRRLKIGYNRAARLIEKMEQDGIVSAMQSNGSREVIAPPPPAGIMK